MIRRHASTIRTHFVPLAFFTAAILLLVSSGLKVLLGESPTYFSPPVGAAMGVFYILIGGAYEWTIKKEKDTEEWYQRQKEALEELELHEGE